VNWKSGRIDTKLSKIAKMRANCEELQRDYVTGPQNGRWSSM